MARPQHLAVAVAAVAAVVVPLRNLFTLEALSEFDLMTLSLLSRVLWGLISLVGLAGAGYVYGAQSGATERPRRTLSVATLAAFVGLLVGYLAVSLGADSTFGGSGLAAATQTALYVALDAASFGFITLGGYALAVDQRA